MEDTRITFETAKLAKKKGFLKEWAELAYKKDDQKLYGDTGIYTDYPAPTQSLLSKWLREKHGVDISILILGISDYQVYVHKKRELKYNGIVNFVFENKDNIYEEAYEIGLQEALKLI